MDYGTNETEVIVKDTLNAFWDEAIGTAQSFYDQVPVVAKKHNVDAGYLMQVLFDRVQRWKEIVGDNKDAMWVARKLYIHSPVGRGPDKPFTMPDTMEGEARVTDAIRELGVWCKNTYIPALDRIFARLFKEAARKIAVVQGISPRAAGLEFLNLAKQAVRMRPHWFRDMLSLSKFLHINWFKR